MWEACRRRKKAELAELKHRLRMLLEETRELLELIEDAYEPEEERYGYHLSVGDSGLKGSNGGYRGDDHGPDVGGAEGRYGRVEDEDYRQGRQGRFNDGRDREDSRECAKIISRTGLRENDFAQRESAKIISRTGLRENDFAQRESAKIISRTGLREPGLRQFDESSPPDGKTPQAVHCDVKRRRQLPDLPSSPARSPVPALSGGAGDRGGLVWGMVLK